MPFPYEVHTEVCYDERTIGPYLLEALRSLTRNDTPREQHKVISHTVTPTTPGRYLISIIYETIYIDTCESDTSDT